MDFSPSDFRLTEATPADGGKVLALIGEYFAYDQILFIESEVTAGLSTLLSNPELGRVFLLTSGESVAGYLILTFGYDLEFGGRQATITDFYLKPGFRRLGLGSRAFGMLESICAKIGVRALELQVEIDNDEARAFYKKVGFRAHDRVPMSKRLSLD